METGTGSTVDASKGHHLDGLRKEITATDQEIIKLLGRRRELVLEVGEVKRANGMPVRDLQREVSLIAILCSAGSKVGLTSDYVKALYKVIIEQSVAEELELMK